MSVVVDPKGNVDFRVHPKQALALESKATELLYGGAAGGGKSHLARVLAILWCLEIPGIQIFFFRRLYDDLIKNHIEGPTGFTNMLSVWINGKHPASPLKGKRLAEVVEGEIRFWNGSKIFLCHLQHQKDLIKYQGPEFHVLFIEEATQFSEYMIRFLRSRLRIPDALKIPAKYLKPMSEWKASVPTYYFPRAIYTANPGGVGHAFLKKSFITGYTPFDYHKASDLDGGYTRQFIPASVNDNPSINREEVKASLLGLPPVLVDALLNGNWDAVVGSYFPEIDPSKHLLDPFPIPTHWMRFMSMDWGSCGEADPFSIQWWAVSDGDTVGIPRNALVCYRSWYGGNLPKITVEYVASGIREREKMESISYRVAGGDIQQKRGSGPSVFEVFNDEGIYFQRADQRRMEGATMFRSRLVGSEEKAMILWFKEDAELVESIMNLQHDLNNPNECTSNDDHYYESTRYAVMSRPWVANKPIASLSIEEKFKKPTLSELWDVRERKIKRMQKYG